MVHGQKGTLSRSPPPCGEGLGVGVRIGSFSWVPPSLASRASYARLGPHKGGGNGETFARSVDGRSHA